MNQQLTVREAYLEASSFLNKTKNQNTQDPSQVCRWMLEALFEWKHNDFFLRWNEPFPMDKSEQWQDMLNRKTAGEPVQYIIGSQEFYGYNFKVTPSVLIPRPETEILVEKMMQECRHIWQHGEPIIADVGTGSGIIPTTLAINNPSWKFIAIDISDQALHIAKENALAHEVKEQIEFVQGDLLEPLIESKREIDVLISNPPYIPSKDMQELQTEVKDFEPSNALDGGTDGLYFYEKMIKQISELSKIPKVVGFEVGQGQTKEVAAWLKQLNQWNEVYIVDDLAGIGRHVLAIRGEL
ncbi:peptide chain release factor N(5)-glutamine methyltransferase [Chengkuizengella axinellae]|uniref:peptide chain release factor N(5)-glutamine methyltransferase n=1 Tax=Chengkuizengella axinellae TaxID=3064388 RepID=A0ABT9J5B4_9BACL|nr:peptide chain release factor N(5)-glutamine methyltransferase [Chengkuizengella sp. 2205SS18-9]MDP5276807.1 peptide chain release factor N(5)-glutamine methyltransferase [Chengkuizengella sp. 2205SS18-9]